MKLQWCPFASVVEADRLIPARFDGYAVGPLVLVRPGTSAGLLAHELTHVRQFWRTGGMYGLLSICSARWRQRFEVGAYRAQLAVAGPGRAALCGGAGKQLRPGAHDRGGLSPADGLARHRNTPRRATPRVAFHARCVRAFSLRGLMNRRDGGRGGEGGAGRAGHGNGLHGLQRGRLGERCDAGLRAGADRACGVAVHPSHAQRAGNLRWRSRKRL